MEISGDPPAIYRRIDFYFKLQYIDLQRGGFYDIPGFVSSLSHEVSLILFGRKPVPTVTTFNRSRFTRM